MKRASEQPIRNAFSVDVEEYFQVSAFDRVVARDRWDSIPSRVRENTERMLDLLERFDAVGTFFVLGWIAERYPEVVRAIVKRGHEIACHGYDHRLLYNQERRTLLEDTRRARCVLQDVSGQEVRGYRAASFSVGRSNFWALDVLVEAGFAYDSSLFPVRHDRYGIPGSPRHIHRVRTAEGNELIEIPPSTIRVAGMTLPVAGGGYLRLLPLSVTRWAMRRINVYEGRPAVVYVHPWEIDAGQPRIDEVSALTRWRHYSGLRGMAGKLESLLATFRFATMTDVLVDSGFEIVDGVRPEAKRVGS